MTEAMIPSMSPTSTGPLPQLRRWAWLPVPLLLMALLILRAMPLPGIYSVYLLTLLLGLFFATLTSLLLIFLFSRSFLVTGIHYLLWFTCGALFWGLSSPVGATLVAYSVNAGVTAHNLCAWFSALVQLIGVITLRSSADRLRSTGWWLGLGFLLTLAVVAGIATAALSGWLPTFFVQGHGGTLVRELTLGSAILMLVVTAVMLLTTRRPAYQAFVVWYAYGLLLIAVGLFGLMLLPSVDSIVGWVGKSAQWLSGIYMLAAALAFLRTSAITLIETETTSTMRHWYGVAIITVLIATVIRLVFLRDIGMQAPFILFYPAVMIAALYGGIPAGLLATILSAMVADYFWIPPFGLITVGRPDEMISLCIFLLGGCLMSGVAGMMHRAQLRAREAELQARLAIARQEDLEALARERAFLEAAINGLPQALAFFDPQGQVVLANPAARRLRERLHLDAREPVPVCDPHTRVPVPADRHPVARALRGEMVESEEACIILPDDTVMPALVSVAPITLDGATVAVVSTIEDITVLKEADRAKDEFLAVLSHELQTPLTNMLGWSTEALRDDDPELMARAMVIVHRNAIRQRRLVEEILDMSRLLHRKIELQVEETDLGLQASQAVESVAHDGTRQHQQLVLDLCADPLPVRADPVRLQQCIGNLLHNSLKFTPEGGSITVRCRRDGDRAVLSVIDTGRGIDPAALPTLFQVFRQVDRDERAGGLGLGLAVTRGIIELHGGTVTADSPGIDQGSTFSISLPLAG